MNRAADELNSEASELIRAASRPQTTTPVNPAGSIWATRVENALSESGCPVTALMGMTRRPFLYRAKAIMPGIRKMKTGSSLK